MSTCKALQRLRVCRSSVPPCMNFSHSRSISHPPFYKKKDHEKTNSSGVNRTVLGRDTKECSCYNDPRRSEPNPRLGRVLEQLVCRSAVIRASHSVIWITKSVRSIFNPCPVCGPGRYNVNNPSRLVQRAGEAPLVAPIRSNLFYRAN